MPEIENPDNRQSFQHLPGSENPQFLEDAKEIMQNLRKKYPGNLVNDLDNILNALCLSLHILMINAVKPECQREFVKIIAHILEKNIEHQEKKCEQ